MASQKNTSKKSLTRLRELCDQLSDRDDQLKKDLQLFEGFFSTFPIPVTMWSIGKDHRVLSVRGEGYTCSKASTLEEMFECDHLRDQSVDKHELALSGEVVTFFVESNDCVYWTKLVPRENDKGESIGVIGMAINFLIAIIISSITKPPPIEVYEIVDNIRMPGENKW